MKRLLTFLLAITMLFALASCGKTPDADIRVISLKGPTGMGMAKLMKDAETGATVNHYLFQISSEPAEVQAAIIAGEVDIAALPVNLASVLYNKGEDIRFLAINTLGVLYILENGNEIGSVEDLRGKTIYATGKGSTPQYVLEYLLKKNGIDPEADVTIEYLGEHAELATKLAANDAAIGMLPEPNVTVALSSAASSGNETLRIALNLTEEWAKLGEGELVQGCLVVSGAFADAHPEQIKKFMAEYKASVEYTVANVQDAASLIAEYGIIPKAPLAVKALPNSNICCLDGEEGISCMKGILGVLYEANPKSVGGALPKDGFYGK